jgi:LmbE family N-acetylglucosaminyl deacetylase
MMTVLLSLAGVLAAGGLAVWAYALVARGPRTDREPEHDVVILAAHPDDCVIMAGEYAAAAVSWGRTVHIVYLTCGADRPDDELARTRRAEAWRAWGQLGVKPEAFTYLDLPNSPLAGPVASSAAEQAAASTQLETLLRAQAPGTAVFVPAAGEMHADHRLLRRLALDVLARLNGGLRVCEAPEYNTYLSLWHAPRDTMDAVLNELVPMWRRLRPKPARRCRFITGGPALQLPPNAARLDRKRAMLREFVSQNAPLVETAFGHPDQYREVRDFTDYAGWYLPVGEHFIGPATLSLWLATWLLAAVVAGWLGQLALALQPVLFGIVALACAALCWRARSPEKRGLYAAATAGWLLFGLLATPLAKGVR